MSNARVDDDPSRRSVLLPDGRSLPYAEYGAPDGRVIVNRHGRGLSDSWPRFRARR
jgi:hypothetical protein